MPLIDEMQTTDNESSLDTLVMKVMNTANERLDYKLFPKEMTHRYYANIPLSKHCPQAIFTQKKSNAEIAIGYQKFILAQCRILVMMSNDPRFADLHADILTIRDIHQLQMNTISRYVSCELYNCTDNAPVGLSLDTEIDDNGVYITKLSIVGTTDIAAKTCNCLSKYIIFMKDLRDKGGCFFDDPK